MQNLELLKAAALESNTYACTLGRIVKLLVTLGQDVEAKDPLVTIAS